jgi:hypothetical protein
VVGEHGLVYGGWLLGRLERSGSSRGLRRGGGDASNVEAVPSVEADAECWAGEKYFLL